MTERWEFGGDSVIRAAGSVTILDGSTFCMAGPSGDVVKAAAARIHEVLQHALLNPAGYVDMHCARVERPRDQEIDDINEARWNHRGGHYEVWVTPV